MSAFYNAAFRVQDLEKHMREKKCFVVFTHFFKRSTLGIESVLVLVPSMHSVERTHPETAAL